VRRVTYELEWGKSLSSFRNNDQREVAQEVQGRQEVITDRPVRNQAAAKEMAKEILCNFRGDLVRGSGSTVGLPDLRAGNRIVIRGLGARFSGSYFVTSSTHTIGPSGYKTNFESRREGPEVGA
jgi:phage protein D